ncbi:MAG: hypothetical protein Q9163_001808 [Psora crenata]
MSTAGDDHALADITAQLGNTKIKGNAEAVKRARESGWVEPTEYDYESYNATAKEQLERGNAPAWASNATRYEWKDEYGDVGPAHPELEKMLFGDENQMRKGPEFEKLASIEVTFECKTRIQPVAKFEDAGLHPIMLENVRLCGYEVPTPIQAYVLPSILKNLDVIGVAQTGSGKTAAYLIPVLSKLMGKAKKLAAPRPDLTKPYTRDDGVRGEPLVLVVVPTRELATQIFDEARRLCYRSMLRPCVVYGGAPPVAQMNELHKGYTIIDEADEMVSPDWVGDMQAILGGDSNDDEDHVYMMFSATFPKEARAVAREYMSVDHVRIRVGRAGSSHKNIIQQVVFVDEEKKRQALYERLMTAEAVRTIIFVNNKKAADFLDDFLYNLGLPSTSLHADRTQIEREDAIRAFKRGKAPILIATGVSARGLDIKNVMHVINYDLPRSIHGGIDEYVHRIGRTGRIGNVGLATSFYNERDEDIAVELVKTLVEMNQEVPDFLEAYKPGEGETLTFDDDTDDEGEGAGDKDVGGTSGGVSSDSWGAEASGAGWS